MDADRAIRFEISSKIPGEELPESYDHAKYFKQIEKRNTSSKKPVSADMENIVRETRDQERKERDYVKLTYQYVENELYDDKDMSSRTSRISRMVLAARKRRPRYRVSPPWRAA